ncbi:hypothetical protein DB347_02005 [Opitutaceae bacterium EW11]|nr:hypothetical protein DB347_02005 [Opitutaceae bacterium EW11]
MDLPFSFESASRAGQLFTALALAAGAAGTASAQNPDGDMWRNVMRQISPSTYVARHVSKPPAIDGDLNDEAWKDIPWTRDFGDILPWAPKPLFRTHAKIAWDDECLYIAAELEEPHVWANQVVHDSVIYRDPDFEVFLDPDGDTHNYYEFEMNARNTTWDLLLEKTYQDGGPARNEWEIAGAKSAVKISGTINDPSDTDKGWTLEIAFPWASLAKYAQHPGLPVEGEQWRLNFSRVEWRVFPEPPRYRKAPNTPEDNWLWSPQGVVDAHRPEMWGIVQFTRQPADVAVSVKSIPGKVARDIVLDVYYAQRDYAAGHEGSHARSLQELGWFCDIAQAGLELPTFEATKDGYLCHDSFVENGERITWTIRQDRLLTMKREPLQKAANPAEKN